jgi:hypothetical protein
VKDLNQKKSNYSRDMNVSLEKMGKIGIAQEKEKELKHYRQLLQSYGRVAEQEFDSLKPLLGTERMAQYLQIKQDLTTRIKTMILAPPAAKDSKVLPPPQLIEEK